MGQRCGFSMNHGLPKTAISDEGKKLITDFDEEFNEDELTATQQARAK